jgi:hypothetical protein
MAIMTSRVAEMRIAYKVLFGKNERMRPLGMLMHRWQDRFKINRKNIGFEIWTGYIWLGIL